MEETSNNNSLDVCCICLENITIPVEPMCFQCKDQDNGGMSCFSMKRLCLVCLENYLELRKHRAERSIKKKCLFCPKITHMHQTPKNKTLRVDYMIMDKDHTIKKCPMPECLFESTHIQVAKHIFSDCPSYFVECECGFTCMRKNMSSHYRVCDKHHICDICDCNVLQDDLPRHMYYEHDKTKCFTCHQFITMSDLSDHIIAKCPERLITCDICSSFIRYKLFKNHLRRHIVDVSKNVQVIKNKLREEEYAYQHIQKLIKNLSQEFHQQQDETTEILLLS